MTLCAGRGLCWLLLTLQDSVRRLVSNMDTTHAGCTVSPEMSTSCTRDTVTLPPPGGYRETKLERAQVTMLKGYWGHKSSYKSQISYNQLKRMK